MKTATAARTTTVPEIIKSKGLLKRGEIARKYGEITGCDDRELAVLRNPSLKKCKKRQNLLEERQNFSRLVSLP